MTVLFQNPELFVPLLAMVCLLVGSGFFSSSETALFFLSTEEVAEFQRSGRASELRVVALLRDSDRLLTAVLFWNLVINLAFFSCVVVITGRLIEMKSPALAGAFSFVSLGAMIVFGEVIPKSSAVLFRGHLSKAVSLPLAFAVRTFDPLAPTFRWITRSLRKMFWPAVRREKYLHADDLEQAIENSAGSRYVLHQERQVLHNILDLSEYPVEEIMRPRGTYPAFRPPVRLADLRSEKTAAEYVVILNENGEDIEGAVSLSQFATLTQDDLAEATEKIIHVPWCSSVAHVLQRLEDHGCQVASIINEYGDTVGIATYEDIVDTILAAEPSRARRVLKREPVLKIENSEFHVDAITSLRYLCRRLNLEFVPEADGQVTVAGLFHELLEKIPEDGDECHWRGYRFRVLEIQRRGHFRVLVTKESS
jgi:CBS domain containing-hemolysin-like protein